MKPSDIQYLYKSIRISAAESVLDPDDEYIYRKICRWYSKTFHTPLVQVLVLDPEHVLTNYYESTMEDIPYNDLYDITIEEFIPDLAEKQDQDAEEYAKALEEEQARTLAIKAKKAKIEQSINHPDQTMGNIKNDNKQQSLTHKSELDQSSQTEEINLTFDDENPEEP